MSFFSNLSNDGLEQAEDRIGGGFQALDTDVYTGTIKMAYAGQAQSGARNVTLLVDIDGKDYRETIYITNRNGENFFLNKQDTSKKVPLPGFTTIDDICLVATGAPLCDQKVEDKLVNVWDRDAKKELPKSMPVLVDLLGKQVSLGIVKQTVNVSEKQGDDYVATEKERDENLIDKVFDVETKLTVVEARNGLEAGVFWTSWLERNKGQTRDKRTFGKDGGAQSGRPGRAAGAPPQAGNSNGPAKSLFGNRKAG